MRSRPFALAVLAVGLFSLATPARGLVFRGALDTPGRALGLDVVGEFAYVADGPAGLRIIDLSAPDAPVEVGSLALPDWTQGVTVVGHLAYVANDDLVRVIDVSDPTAPVQVGIFDTPGSANHVEVVGNLAYVADGAAGLRILDVSNPAAPVAVGSFATPGFAHAVRVSGTLAYVAAGSFGLRVLNVANPAAPTSVRVYNSPGDSTGLQVSGTLVHLADGSAGLRIVDVAPFPVAVLGIFDPPESSTYYTRYARDVEVVGTLAYLAGVDSGPYGASGWLRVVDVSDPASAFETDLVWASSSLYYSSFDAVEVNGPFVIVAASEIGLRIYNASAVCSDGLDDDGDGLVDFPDDPGCFDADSDLEDPHCQDGIDNDGQLGTDFDGGASVLGSGNADPDGPDPQCVDKPWKQKEGGGGCGLGFELAPVLGLLAWRRRSRAQRLAGRAR